MENKYLQEIGKYRKKKTKNRFTFKKHIQEYIPIKYNPVGKTYISIILRCKICGKKDYKLMTSIQFYNIYGDMNCINEIIIKNNKYFKEKERRNK